MSQSWSVSSVPTLADALQELHADLMAQQEDNQGFPDAYMGADVACQWQVRQILSVSDHHHLDEVMVAWEQASPELRDAVRAAMDAS